VFTVLELLGFALAFYLMHYLPKSRYDYLLVFVIFGLLIIGISGISYTSYLWNPKWTKFFGIASMLIVLNHYSFCVLLRNTLSHLEQWQKILIYIGLTVASCIVVYLLSALLKRLFKILFQKKLWLKEQEENNQK
jgi:peptidoglycan/LPS O-acetylase OafA/YrhL